MDVNSNTLDKPCKANGNGTSVNGHSSPAVKKRVPLFRYPALPTPEIWLCFAVTIGAVVYGWRCVWSASQRFHFRYGHPASYRELPLGLGGSKLGLVR